MARFVGGVEVPEGTNVYLRTCPKCHNSHLTTTKQSKAICSVCQKKSGAIGTSPKTIEPCDTDVLREELTSQNKKMTKCICCKKEIKDLFRRKYCNNCSNFTYKIRSKVSYYKSRFEALNKKKYGIKNGRERVRYSKVEDDK